MTRINCVPVEELSDKHLGAEYRELPRVFALAQAAYRRGEKPEQYPQEYLLGPGHVKFFYARLAFVANRCLELAEECERRGRAVNYRTPPTVELPIEWWGIWVPTPQAIELNRQRIADRSPK